MMDRKGYTLMEILIAVAIVGILSAAAITNYGRTIQLSRFQTMNDVLQQIYTGEQVYFSNKDTFLAAACTSSAANQATWRLLYVDSPCDGTVTYVVDSVAAATSTTSATFTATATWGTKTRTINQDRTLGGNWTTP